MSRSPRDQNRSASKPLSGMQILFASILAIGLLLAINFSSRIAAGQRIQRDRQALEMEIATLEAEQAALIQERDYARSDEYVVSWARSEGKMVQPNEVLVIPVPASKPLPTATPTPLPPEALFPEEEPIVENWRLWWALFFDSDPPF
ncbi:MAG: hypothetical protein HPY64_02940 [Anaerolineae bacterium]|nr:hypothetical protein [Anaerolineae bacterium]